LNVLGIIDIRQIEVHTAEPSVCKASSFKVEVAVEKLKRYKSAGIYQIPAELIQAGGNTLCSEIHKLINPIWNKGEVPQQWKESIIILTVVKLTVVIVEEYHCYQLHTELTE
jgi:hypothetical protein